MVKQINDTSMNKTSLIVLFSFDNFKFLKKHQAWFHQEMALMRSASSTKKTTPSRLWYEEMRFRLEKKISNCGKVNRILRLLGLALGLLTWVWISVFLTCPRIPLHLRLANNSPSHSQWRANDIRHVELKRIQWQYPYPLEPYNSMGQRQSNAIATRILRQHIKLNQWIQHGLTWDLLIQSASGVMLSLSLGGRAGPRKLGDCFNRGFLDEARWSNFPSSRWITLTTILDPQSDHLES